MSMSLEYPVVVVALVAWLASWWRRGISQDTLIPAILDGGAAGQFPIGAAILASVLGLIDSNTVSQVMSQPMIATWAGNEITEKDGKSVQLLARQPIDLDRPHPFTAAGATEFNCLLWMPPNEQRAGDIVLVDSTNFTTLFGGTDSLENFWRNLALMR